MQKRSTIVEKIIPYFLNLCHLLCQDVYLRKIAGRECRFPRVEGAIAKPAGKRPTYLSTVQTSSELTQGRSIP